MAGLSMRAYSFAEVLTYSAVTRSQAINLTAKRVIVPDLGESAGTGHPRRFSLLNLVEFELGSELVRIGVEHTAINQVLRRLRWLIGDPTGLPPIGETVADPLPEKTEAKPRDDMEPTPLPIDPIDPTDATSTHPEAGSMNEVWDWLNDLDLDNASEREDEPKRGNAEQRLDARVRAQDSVGQPTAEADIAAQPLEHPDAHRRIRQWTSFLPTATRPLHFFLVAWAIDSSVPEPSIPGDSRGSSKAPWNADLIDSAAALADRLSRHRGHVVIDLHRVVTHLEAESGELLEEAERLRVESTSTGDVDSTTPTPSPPPPESS